jgi:hypothetical protein
MKHRNIPKILLSLFVFVFINSCALPTALIAQAQQGENWEQVEITNYYVPEDLNGDAQNTGLLLIDAVRKTSHYRQWAFSGVTIASLNEPGKKISTGTFYTRVFFGRNSGVVIIPGLAPGFYNIIEITIRHKDLQLNKDLQHNVNMRIADIAIEVKANTAVYYGQIQIPWDSTDKEIKLKYVKKREIESWRMVSNRYNDSPWATIIDEHIKNLE